MEINKDLIISETDIKLENLIPNNFTTGTPFRIGTFTDPTNGRKYPVYKLYLELGALPNAATMKTYAYNIPNFYGILNASFIAYSGDRRIVLPYIYPNINYTNYWITLEAFTSESISVVTGMDRSNFNLWACFEYVAYR